MNRFFAKHWVPQTLRWCVWVVLLLFAPLAAAAGDPDASFVSQSVPASMVAGQRYTVTIKMRNEASSTWSSTYGFQLNKRPSPSINPWTENPIAVAGSIITGQTATFTATVTAPTTPGTYSFVWQMSFGDQSYFGEPTEPLNIVVSAPPPAPGIVGNIDATPLVGSDYRVTGWACDTGKAQSISVHVYVGGPAGVGTNVAVAAANLPSEPAVAASCKSTGAAYRFSIPLTSSIRQAHANKKIYVHGISVSGGSNLTIKNSGVFVVPPPLSTARIFTYDQNHRLCKTIDPETGVKYFFYDPAGNLVRTELAPSASTSACGVTAPANPNVSKTYDARSRVKSVTYSDGKGDQTLSYAPDGLPVSIVTDNGDGNIVKNSYSYNQLRLLVGERLTWNQVDWSIIYNYNAGGSLSSQVWHGLTVDYAPNALGQPTKAGTFASNVSYHPNGAIKQFTYGNGIVHTMTQNLRGLPDRSRDAATAAVLDDSYDYDQNGNVLSISDALDGNRGNRTMSYDDRDRLAIATSPMFGGQTLFTYDALDNLRRFKAPGRDHTYVYDGSNRLTNVTNTTGGATVIGLGYDARGNLSNKNGQNFTFDIGNRLRSVDANGATIASYVYDGLGRRVRDYTTASKYSQYTKDGRLSLTSDGRANKVNEYVYLGGSLVAIRERDTPTNTYKVLYQHTDALGSPVAITGENKALVERREYEPYGDQLVPATLKDGPGYTGHVSDAATGLSYMQQRYYDPSLGRFLSVDPVTADARNGSNFNRYWYANNNPYKFADPDGRESGAVFSTLYRQELQYGMTTSGTQLTEQQAGAIVDFMPIFGDVKGFVDAYNEPSIINITAASIGLAGPLGDAAGKMLKTANKVEGAVGIIKAGNKLPSPPTGPGKVAKADRDPKRLFTPSERASKRAEQGNKCANGCGAQIDASNSAGHHIERHADGGMTVPENHAEVCIDCHKILHSGN